MSLTVTLLGAPSVQRDGVPVSITARKVVALLAYLAISGRPHTRDDVATLFWPEADSEHARGALRYTLSQLRAELGDQWLFTTREEIGLAARDDLYVDAGAIEALFARVREHGHPLRRPCMVCAPLLREAVALQRGPLLAGFSLPDSPAFDDWLLFEAERLQRAQADAFQALIGVCRDAGAPDEAIPYAQRWLALDTLDDDANVVLIELLADSGQRAAARRHYAAYANLLRAELDAEPAAAATAVIERLQTVARAPQAPVRTDSASVAPAAAEPAPLPRAAGPLVGRAHEVAAIGRLLDDPSCRVLTLLGPGGSGKTQLAIAVAEARQPRYADGAAWVSLAGVDAPGSVAAVAAAAIGCPLAAGDAAEPRLLDFVRQRRMLLVLDNIEQLLGTARDDAAGAVEFVEHILQIAPHLQLLITSRVRLQLYEEQLYPVQGLPFPDWDAAPEAHAYAAVELFVARARRLQPSFALDASTMPAVTRIVRLLAGQPLAIELAAGWTGTLQPGDIARQLERGLDLLATDARNVPARHRSMRASYALSWQQLGPAEQAAQQALSVFRGGFTPDAAEHVAGTTPRLVRRLVDQSLVSLSGEHSRRYQLHELLRQFAVEQLARDPQLEAQVRGRHAAYYVAMVETVAPTSQEHLHSEGLAQVQVEYDNHLAALQWMLQREDSAGSLRLCLALAHVWDRRGQLSEGRKWLRTALALSGDGTGVVRAEALELAGRFAAEQGDWSEAVAVLDQAVILSRTLGDTRRIARLLRTQGWIALLRGEYAGATALLAESVGLYRTVGDKQGIARVLGLQGQAAYEQRAFAEAIPLLTESVNISRALDEHIDAAWSVNKLGWVALYQGDWSEAERLLQDCLAVFETLDYTRGVAWVRGSLGCVRLGQGAYTRAAELLEDSLARYSGLGETRNIAYSLERLACVASVQGQSVRAARLFGAATTLRHERGVLLPPVDRQYYLQYHPLTHVTLDTSEDLAAAWAQGAAFSTTQAIDYALGKDHVSEASSNHG